MRNLPKVWACARIRHDTRPPLLVRLLAFRKLLCDSGNLTFKGFVSCNLGLGSTGTVKKADEAESQRRWDESAEQMLESNLRPSRI